MITPADAETQFNSPKIRVTLVNGENQVLSLPVEEIVSMEPAPGNPAHTIVKCRPRVHYLVQESIAEIIQRLPG